MKHIWKAPCKENLIECECGSQMWVIVSNVSESVLLLFNGDFQVKLSGESRQKLIDLLKHLSIGVKNEMCFSSRWW